MAGGRLSARLLAGLVLLAACGVRHPTPPAEPARSPDAAAADAARLAALFQTRTAAGAGDYCLGPGDLLTVSVLGWEAMRDQQVRVSSTGSVTLPMLGAIPGAGRTEGQLREEIEARLRHGYMRDPHVSVFVQRFQSQQVSVTGAVARPGLYSLTRENRTVYDLLAQAGGVTEQAGGRIRFSPAPEAACGAPEASRPPLPGIRRAAVGADTPSVAPIEFDLDGETPPDQLHPLLLPVVGGDAIVVSRGRFMVDGWVAKPGLYAFTPGMTAHGAMSVAGGVLFPANLHHTQIIRARHDGTKEVFEVDLVQVARGDVRDVPLREGDVIRFNASAARMVPYSVYWVFTNLFRVGAGISVAGV